MDDAVIVWPDLPYASWRETAATLQLWTQSGFDRDPCDQIG
jgi:hypothetical protein